MDIQVKIKNPFDIPVIFHDGECRFHGALSEEVKSKSQWSSFIAALLPFFVFTAHALFNVLGGLLEGWIGKKKAPFFGPRTHHAGRGFALPRKSAIAPDASFRASEGLLKLNPPLTF